MQVWILVSLTGVLIATSLGLLLTIGDRPRPQRPERSVDLARSSGPRQAKSLEPRRITYRRGMPWTAQETVSRYRTLLKHIRPVQELVATEEEPEGSPIEVNITGTAHRKIAREVETQLKLVRPGVSKCYQRRLREKPGLRGRVFFSFTLAPDGDVANVGKAHIADSKVHDVRLETCILQALSSVSFPLDFADDPWASHEHWYHYNYNLQRNDGDLRAAHRTTHNP